MASLSRPFALLALLALVLGGFAHECEAASLCHRAPALVPASSAHAAAKAPSGQVVSHAAVLTSFVEPLTPAGAPEAGERGLEQQAFVPAGQGRAPPARFPRGL